MDAGAASLGGSGPEASEEGRLSPASPGRPPSPSLSFSFPATPSAFYRSGFARDCEAIALQLRAGAEPEGAPPPLPPLPPPSRCPSTIEAETLTPLGPSWSFLSETFRTPAGGDERSAEPRPPPDRTPNRTYDCEEGEAGSGSSADSRATFLCQEDPELPAGEPLAEASSFLLATAATDDDHDASSSKARRQTFELPVGPDDGDGDVSRAAAPLVTSTPLLAGLPGGGGGGKRIALEEEEEEGGGCGTRGGRGAGPDPDSAPRSRPKPPMARPLPGSTTTSLGSTRGGAAAGRGLLARKNLALGQGARPAKGGVAVGLPLPGKGVKRAILPQACQGMPGDLRRGSALSGKRPGCPRPSQLQGQKQPPDEVKKSLSKLPCYKGTSVAIQAPPNHTRGGVPGSSLAYVGLGHNASCAENEMSGTKLPVRIAGDKISKTGAQKRLQEKPADSASVQKPPLPKRACQSRGLMEKHAGGTLLAAGQIPRAVPGNGPVALCLKCVQLSEENQRLTAEIQQLKAMLDNCMCKELQLPVGGSCQHSAAMFQAWSEEEAK